MTVILNKPSDFDPARWASMPGWNITVDLTPRELRARRSLAVLRRMIAAVLALVLLVCVGGYLLAEHANSDAQAALDAATADTAEIQGSIGQHASVTQVKAATSALNAQLATLFSNDVDIPKLLATLPNANRSHLTVTSVNLSVAALTTNPTTGATTIGTVTMSGTAKNLNDLAAEVTALGKIRGVTNVIPATNSAGTGGGTAWSLTFGLTSSLYSHRFASTPAPATASSAAATTTGGK